MDIYSSRLIWVWFWVFFVLTIIIGDLSLIQNKKLQNPVANGGILCLELGTDFKTDTAIIHSWKTPVNTIISANHHKTLEYPILKVAYENTITDYFFIITYTLLGIIVILLIQKFYGENNRRWKIFFLALVIIAGIMDCLENIGLFQFISYGFNPLKGNVDTAVALRTAIFSGIKWSLFFALLFYLLYMLFLRKQYRHKTLNAIRLFFQDLNKKIGNLYDYRVIFLGLICFVLPLWLLDQGQDLLVNINSNIYGVPFFLLSVFSVGFINWYLTKLFFRINKDQPLFPFYLSEEEGDGSSPDFKEFLYEKKISRFFGISTIVLPAFAILNAENLTRPDNEALTFPIISILIFVLFLYYLLIKFDVADHLFDQIREGWRSTIIYIIILFFSLGVPAINFLHYNLEETISTPLALDGVFWNLISLSFSFYLFISLRLRIFNSNGLLGNTIGKAIFSFILLNSILFWAINIFPEIPYWGRRWPLSSFLALIILISGVVFYIVFFTLLIRISQKLKINLTLIIMVGSFLYGVIHKSDYHEVQKIQVSNNLQKKEKLESYFKQWVLCRKDEIKEGYPVFLINTYGGGIKAASFTSYFLSYMDSVFLTSSKHTAFQHYAFSISGASGGTIGAAIQCAFRNKYCDSNSKFNSLNTFTKFYQNDFLSSILATNLGRDVIASANPLHWWKDRSAVQEMIWTDFAKGLGNDGDINHQINLGLNFDSFWYQNLNAYETPLLFSNTLNVDSGQKGIYAPVLLDSSNFPKTIFIQDLLDKENNISKPKIGISYITGAFLSARFPFVSPTGKMGNEIHFMDGGGKDNSGASTSDEIFTTIINYLKSAPLKADAETEKFKALVKKLHFYFICIKNDLPQEPNRNIRESSFEQIRPLIGIINSGITGNADFAVETLRLKYSKGRIRVGDTSIQTDYYYVRPTVNNVYVKKAGKSYKPILPLGWQISRTALSSMESNFNRDTIQLEYSKKNSDLLKIISIGNNQSF